MSILRVNRSEPKYCVLPNGMITYGIRYFMYFMYFMNCIYDTVHCIFVFYEL